MKKKVFPPESPRNIPYVEATMITEVFLILLHNSLTDKISHLFFIFA